MKSHDLLFAACLMVAGCTEPGPIDGVQVLSPGRGMRLVFRFEVRQGGGHIEEDRHSVRPDAATQPSIVTKRIETPWESVWGDAEISMRVASMPCSANVRATLEVQRFRMSCTSQKQGEDNEAESSEYKRSSTTAPAAEYEEPEFPQDYLRDAEFVAVIDPTGRVASADATGEFWQGLKKAYARDDEEDSSQIPIDLMIRWGSLGVFPSLADAMAYLPRRGVEPGQSWQVLRENVMPYSAFYFAGFTEGWIVSREESACTLKAVRTGIRGKIAVVTVRGRRFLQFPEPDSSEWSVKFFELAGELEVNLTTGAVEKLRLESVPIWAEPPDEPHWGKLIYVVSLKPA